ncbi:MAG TPA: sialidase family protein, partial [Nitrososphaeraceae archaeon]|nr:sialidase family protein [Nitrososphaeraceae archaeon]
MISFLGHQRYSESIGLENSGIILSNTKYNSINPYFSVSNNNIYSTWVSNLSPNNSEILFKKIDVNSKSLYRTVNISNTIGISNVVKLSTSDHNVYVTWEDKQTDKWKLLFSKSHDKGIKFGAVTDLSNATGNVHLHDLASAGNNVFVLWAANENTSSSNKEIFFRKSQDGGDSFDNGLNLSKDNDDSLDPHMVVNQNGSIIYVVWTRCDTKHDDPDCSVAFTRSLDQGNTFTDSKIIDADKLLPQGSNSTTRNESFDYNSNVIPPFLLDNFTVNEEISSINPIVFTTLEGKQVYVLWEQNTFGKGDSDIFLKSSNDYGNSFNPTINISNSSGTSRLARGDILGEDLYVTWADTLNQTGTFDILLTKINAHNQLGKVLNLSNNPGNSVSPYLWISNT